MWACALVGAALLWVGSGRGPEPPRYLKQFAGALGIAARVDLPAEWTLEKQAPASPASLGLTQPLGALPDPFDDPEARAAWSAWKQGRFSDAARLAEVAWKTLSAPRARASDKAEARRTADRLRLAALLTQTRWSQGDRPGALAAARVAVGDPALGIAVLRWIVSRADEAGLSSVVLTLVGDRDEPALLLLKAKALRRNGDFQEAGRLLKSIAAPAGTGLWRRLQVERVRAAAAAGDDDAALALMRETLAKAGKSTAAEELVDWLLGSADATWQARLKNRPQDGAAVLDALVYSAQRRRYARAIPALEALASQPGIAKPVQCHAWSWAAKAHDRRAEFDKSVEMLDKVRASCLQDPSVTALQVDEDPLGPGDVAWRTGRALGLQGRPEAQKWLKDALAQGLTGLDAEDAKSLATVLASADGPTVLEKQGTVAAQDYAERDMVDVAVWRVALQRLIDGRWKDALPLLDRLVEVRDRDAPPTAAGDDKARYDDRDWSRGRADYFAGRALAELGRGDDAAQRWQRVIARHPLTYYASMSLAQLQARGKVDLPKLLNSPAVTAGPVLDDALLQDEGVQRARLLGQLGWHDEAAEELDLAGLGREAGQSARWATGDPSRMWTRAALDAEAGRWVASHAVARDQLRAFATAWPTASNRTAWEIAFPRGYMDLMEAAAKEFDIHPSILYAICRSESGFNPKVESHAHAIGLLQLILPTAREMAKGLGVDATEATLRQPAVNVRLGAKYLKRLLDRFDREQQMAAGYNAGGGAVGRWRKQRGDWPMDLFVETIPFRETRDYAKRVSGAIATYRALYHNEPLYALGISQKSVPAADEPPTEPPSKPADGGQRTLTPPPAAPVDSDALEPALVVRHPRPAAAPSQVSRDLHHAHKTRAAAHRVGSIALAAAVNKTKSPRVQLIAASLRSPEGPRKATVLARPGHAHRSAAHPVAAHPVAAHPVAARGASAAAKSAVHRPAPAAARHPKRHR